MCVVLTDLPMYIYPLDFDQVTNEQIPKSTVNLMITKEDWGSHRSKAKEETSSLVSGRLYRHYKAGLRSGYISHLQALIASLMIKRGIVLGRWS